MSFIQSAVTLAGRTQIPIAAGGYAPVDVGVYDVWAATDTYIAVVPSDYAGAAPTSSTGYLVPAGGVVSVRIAKDGMKMGASAATSIHKVE